MHYSAKTCIFFTLILNTCVDPDFFFSKVGVEGEGEGGVEAYFRYPVIIVYCMFTMKH